MKVQILGSGCDKCKKLAANAQEAATQLGLTCEIEKVTDINEITASGVMMTPALVIDGMVVSSGKVLSPNEIAEHMKSGAAQKEETGTKACSCGCGTPTEACSCGTPKKDGTPTEDCGCGCGTTGKDGTSTPKPPVAPACGCCNSPKKGVTLLLLLFVLASIAFVVIREVRSRQGAAQCLASGTACTNSISAKGNTTPVPATPGVLMVYYFHGTQRCMTCKKIEELTKEAISSKYAKELANGKVLLQSVNIDEPANEHFIKDFQLSSRSVVMQKDGNYEKFDDVWTLVHTPEEFTKYLQDGAVKMLTAK
ncbi:MAG: nitrophenyl compound nitroreductase subunit ArsF family protein [Lentisphaeria bacterium]